MADPTTGETIFINICAQLVTGSSATSFGGLPEQCNGAAACRVATAYGRQTGTAIGHTSQGPQHPSGGAIELWCVYGGCFMGATNTCDIYFSRRTPFDFLCTAAAL